VTLAENTRMILAAIRAAKKEGVPMVEVIFGDGSTVRIPLEPGKPIAEPDEIVL
jgi:hypothetical protein